MCKNDKLHLYNIKLNKYTSKTKVYELQLPLRTLQVNLPSQEDHTQNVRLGIPVTTYYMIRAI